jgi:hypothetical protein
LEVTASADIYGIPLHDVVAQLAGVFPNAEDFEMDEEPASRVPPVEEDGVIKEVVLAAHEGQILILNHSYANDAASLCQPAWEELLASWKWITPDFALYRNAEYGYGVGHPREWYRFNASDRGLYMSSVDPTGVQDLHEIMRRGMLVQTDVLENRGGEPLREWVTHLEGFTLLTRDVPLGEVLGVLALRHGPSPDIQETSGYFQGPLGDIYVITCRYPAAQEWEFRPIANAIIHSFTF